MTPGETPFEKPNRRLTYREKMLKSGKIERKTRPMLSPVSKKQQKKNNEYNKEKEKYLKEHPNCELCGRSDNLSLHHKQKRGKHLSDSESFATLCLMGSEDFLQELYPEANHSHNGGCHGFVEGNKAWARNEGLIK